MPYELPTSDMFTTRFPIFADADSDLIDMLILEASGSVDQSWREEDYQPAIMYLAAHLYATDNSAEGSSVNYGGSGGSGTGGGVCPPPDCETEGSPARREEAFEGER